MGRLHLVLPGPEHRAQVMAYRQEFLDNGDDLAGTAGLRQAERYEDWQKQALLGRFEETAGAGLVPATTFLALTGEGRLVGMIQIRHRLSPYLRRVGGHIGYSVRQSERRKGYGAEMLALALEECRQMGLWRVLLTCDKRNIASARTMMKNGAVLENELEGGGRVTQRYWITLGPEEGRAR